MYINILKLYYINKIIECKVSRKVFNINNLLFDDLLGI